MDAWMDDWASPPEPLTDAEYAELDKLHAEGLPPFSGVPLDRWKAFAARKQIKGLPLGAGLMEELGL